MLTTELIIKAAEKAEGYHIKNQRIVKLLFSPGRNIWENIDVIKMFWWKDAYYPLLLSRACDALGICIDCIDGEKDSWSWAMFDDDDMIEPYKTYLTADQAREAALEYYFKNNQ